MLIAGGPPVGLPRNPGRGSVLSVRLSGWAGWDWLVFGAGQAGANAPSRAGQALSVSSSRGRHARAPPLSAPLRGWPGRKDTRAKVWRCGGAWIVGAFGVGVQISLRVAQPVSGRYGWTGMPRWRWRAARSHPDVLPVMQVSRGGGAGGKAEAEAQGTPALFLSRCDGPCCAALHLRILGLERQGRQGGCDAEAFSTCALTADRRCRCSSFRSRRVSTSDCYLTAAAAAAAAAAFVPTF
eukprot:68525-Chlamydomonas_euryale.AAC.3